MARPMLDPAGIPMVFVGVKFLQAEVETLDSLNDNRSELIRELVREGLQRRGVAA
jgi:metal-responsive CopG/Arc/MetJ family transcriptional regulator